MDINTPRWLTLHNFRFPPIFFLVVCYLKKLWWWVAEHCTFLRLEVFGKSSPNEVSSCFLQRECCGFFLVAISQSTCYIWISISLDYCEPVNYSLCNMKQMCLAHLWNGALGVLWGLRIAAFLGAFPSWKPILYMDPLAARVVTQSVGVQECVSTHRCASSGDESVLGSQDTQKYKERKQSLQQPVFVGSFASHFCPDCGSLLDLDS